MAKEGRRSHPAIWLGMGFALILLLASGFGPLLFRNRCIVEGVPIDTPEGPLPVQAVRVGTSVWTSGPDGRREAGRVTAVHPGRSSSFLEVDVEGGFRLKATATHPVRTPAGWKDAGSLQPVDEVVTRDGPRVVSSRRRVRREVRVFDLEVEPNANFYADGVLVHNKSRNDRNAMHSLKTISTAQADFRANDRDRNGESDFWVADVAGLYAILAANGQSIGLIEISIATADARPKPDAGGTTHTPTGAFQPKAGYQFRALTHYEDEKGNRVPYDTGKGRNPGRFGFVAEAAPGYAFDTATFIVNEANTVYWKDLKKGISIDTFPRDPLREGWSTMEWFR